MPKPICTFFSKTNACKHGDDCIKTHLVPQRGLCVILKNLYLYPEVDSKSTLNDFEVGLHSEIFYEDIFTELALEFGEITKMFIAANSCRHIAGNVYIQFRKEEDADHAMIGIPAKTYYYSKINVERGAMYDIDDALCGDYLRGNCSKGGDCSYVHPLQIFSDDLYYSQEKYTKRIK